MLQNTKSNQEYFLVGAKQTFSNCFYSFPCHMKRRENKIKKKNLTSLFCVFDFRSDVHERLKESCYLHVCSGQRWRCQREWTELLPKYETQISILRFAGGVFRLIFAIGSVIWYRWTPSILVQLWSFKFSWSRASSITSVFFFFFRLVIIERRPTF